MSNFKEVCTVPTDFGVTFTKFKSEKTGLTVILADIDSNFKSPLPFSCKILT